MQPELGTTAPRFSDIYLGRRYYGIGIRGLMSELISPSFVVGCLGQVSYSGISFSLCIKWRQSCHLD